MSKHHSCAVSELWQHFQATNLKKHMSWKVEETNLIYSKIYSVEIETKSITMAVVRQKNAKPPQNVLRQDSWYFKEVDNQLTSNCQNKH